jgi:two-component system sensor histidine kinase RegB
MWVAFGVAATFIVYFLMRVTRALAERDARLAEVERLAAQKERLASLATLAAGAAHELATPLSTIATVARELERATTPDAAADVALIREEVARCRAILDRMAAHAGESAGEEIVAAPVAGLVDEAVAPLAASPPIRVEIDPPCAARDVALPRRAVAQALRVLLKNAQQAGGEIVLRARLDGGRLAFEVRDTGAGMAPEVLARAGEPFFTTKPPGQGMGLGLFLTRAVAEQLGGELVLESRPGGGTIATLTLPATIGRIAGEVAPA